MSWGYARLYSANACSTTCAGSARLIFVLSVYVRLADSDCAVRGSITPPYMMPTTAAVDADRMGEPLEPLAA
jgi:hypothetical protein